VFLAARKLVADGIVSVVDTLVSLFLPGGSSSSIERDGSSKIRAVPSYVLRSR